MYKQKEQVETQIEYQNKEIIREWKDLNINQNEHKLSRFTLIYSKPEQKCHPIPNKRPKTTPFCVIFFPQLSQQPNESFKALPRKPRSSNQSSIISAKTTITMKNNNNEANLFKRSTGWKNETRFHKSADPNRSSSDSKFGF